MATYDCTKCGACCSVFGVPVDAWDEPRVAAALKKHRLPILTDHGYYSDAHMPKTEAGTCAAYVGELGDGGCGIYGDYPKVCGDFAVGSLQCVTSRLFAGIDTAKNPVDMLWKLMGNAAITASLEWQRYHEKTGRESDALLMVHWRARFEELRDKTRASQMRGIADENPEDYKFRATLSRHEHRADEERRRLAKREKARRGEQQAEREDATIHRKAAKSLLAAVRAS